MFEKNNFINLSLNNYASHTIEKALYSADIESLINLWGQLD